MKIGVFGGGFKPFTTGHFSMLSVALRENDLVILYYALASRKKGSDFVFTKDMAKEIYDITKPALERTFGNKIKVVLGTPSPIVKIFSLLEAVKDSNDNALTSLTELGIDPDSIDKLTIYADDNDITKFTRYVGTEKGEKYYGNLVSSGRLGFNSWDSSKAGDIERVVLAMRDTYPDISDEDLRDLITVRGSIVRQVIGTRNRDRLAKYLPDFLSPSDKDNIMAILFSGLSESVEKKDTILREYIRSALGKPVIKEALQAHILNFYEDLEMPLKELFEVIDAVLEGKLENVQEKMDGQNVTFSVIDGELLFYSKGTNWNRVQRGGNNRQTIEVKYKNNQSVREAFLMAYDALNRVVQRNPENAAAMFQNGKVLISSELLAPNNPNTIVYEAPHVRFIKAEAVAPDSTVDQEAYHKFIADAEAETEAMEQKVSMGAIPLLKLKKSLEADQEVDSIRSDLSKLISSAGMTPNKTMGDLAVYLFEKKLGQMGIPESYRSRAAIRIATGSKQALTKNMVVKAVGLEEWKKFQALEKNRSTLMGEALIPIESIIQRIGALAFKNMEFALASNTRESGEDLRKFVRSVRTAFESGRVLADPAQLEKIKVSLQRIGSNEDLFEKAVEGIVFQWKGKTRKLTGLFTPINKLRGFFFYGKAPAKVQESKDDNLRSLIKLMLRN